jgi:hypothetical protein
MIGIIGLSVFLYTIIVCPFIGHWINEHFFGWCSWDRDLHGLKGWWFSVGFETNPTLIGLCITFLIVLIVFFVVLAIKGI